LPKVSNPDKLLFPGITKGEVVGYYEAASGRILPHLVDRPLTLQRFPAGIDQPGFMQKNAGKGFPAFIRRVELPKQGGTVHYPAVDDLTGLLYLANQNTITFHIPCFRASDLDHPDRLVFDLDPAEGDLEGARFAATAVRRMLSEFAIDPLVMTSGSKGFHVVVPLAPTVGFDDLAFFSHAVAYLLALRHEERLTVEFLKKERRGRVFVDWLRNHFGATGVCPYSLRARPGAPVAMPLSWEEVAEIEPGGFPLSRARDRLGSDPWSAARSEDLRPALKQLRGVLADQQIELPPFDRFGRR
jgi:bifunctional non-homologous end joining protein LigD